MRSSASQRILRTILASLLASEHSANELRRFAQELESAASVREIQEAIYSITQALATFHAPRPSTEEDEETLLELVRRKRISKSEIYRRISMISPNLEMPSDWQNMTAREMIQTFLRSGGSSRKAERFAETFLNENEDDAYLQGIIFRNKKQR